MWRRVVCLVVWSLVVTRSAQAGGMPVFDSANWVQNMIQVVYAVQQVSHTLNVVQNQYAQIQGQVAMIAQAAEHLKALDVNYMLQLTDLGGQLVGLLGETDSISYDLAQARPFFDQLYQSVQGVLSAKDSLAMQLKLTSHRRAAAATSVQVQALAGDLRSQYHRVAALLSSGYAAAGTRSAAQVLAQQAGVSQTVMLQQLQVAAANGRLEAQQAAEKAVLDEAALREIAAASASLPAYTGQRGTLAAYHW